MEKCSHGGAKQKTKPQYSCGGISLNGTKVNLK